MPIKTQFAALLCALFIVSCSRATSSIQSPSGIYIAQTEISGDEAGPSRHNCVKLIIIDNQTKKKSTLQTGASDFQKWAVVWSPKNDLILYSSDIGIHAYDITDGTIIERAPTKEETLVATKAYHSKYRN